MDGGVGNDPAKDGGWHLSKSEKAMITSVGGFVAFACALAQYVSSGSGGITAFGISLGVSVAGGLLIVIAVRIFMNRGRKVTIRLLPALAWLAAVLACAGAVGGVVGYFLSRPAAAAVSVKRQPTPTPTSPTPVAWASSTPTATKHMFTEIADNRNGVPVFGSPQGGTTNAPKIPFGTHVSVACYAPNETGIVSINAFYLINSPPWVNVYASANTFANGDPVGEPGSTNIDPAVPPCPGT